MPAPFFVPVLAGSLVRLEPLAHCHVGDLAAAAEENRTSYSHTEVPRAGEVDQFVSAHLARAAAGQMVPFAQVRLSDGRAVGCTAYWDPRRWPERDELCAVMIGWTWLSASAQRTGINAESKLLLLTYAFETLKVARVDFSTDARNDGSRRAIAALGAQFEGVLRNWSRSHAPGERGRLRDSAMFSITDAEWPRVRPTLTERVNRHARDSSTSPLL